jgi:hypothetical protein
MGVDMLRGGHAVGQAPPADDEQAIVTRFMGLIVAFMGMQFVLTGLKEFLSL